MEEIKSVRVRRKSPTLSERFGDLDIKVSLFKDGLKRKAFGTSNGNQIWPTSLYGGKDDNGNRYKGYSDIEVIIDYISLNTKREGKLEDYYEIIQNPWLDKAPRKRKYGSDPYYLNNGSYLIIEWEGDGGLKWSDDDGGELDKFQGVDKSSITKSVTIKTPTDELLLFTSNGIDNKLVNDNPVKFPGNVSDIDIINQVISYWNKQVPNYNLDICSENYQYCNIVDYKSPIDISESSGDITSPVKESKVKLSVVLPENLQLRAKQDISELKVYIGDPPSEFIFSDFSAFDDPEFIESEFMGNEDV